MNEAMHAEIEAEQQECPLCKVVVGDVSFCADSDCPRMTKDMHAEIEAEQLKDEREVRLIRLVQESRELLTDKAQAFADDNWELVYLRAILKADSELRGIFMAGVRAGIEMIEARDKD